MQSNQEKNKLIGEEKVHKNVKRQDKKSKDRRVFQGLLYPGFEYFDMKSSDIIDRGKATCKFKAPTGKIRVNW